MAGELVWSEPVQISELLHSQIGRGEISGRSAADHTVSLGEGVVDYQYRWLTYDKDGGYNIRSHSESADGWYSTDTSSLHAYANHPAVSYTHLTLPTTPYV